MLLSRDVEASMFRGFEGRLVPSHDVIGLQVRNTDLDADFI